VLDGVCERLLHDPIDRQFKARRQGAAPPVHLKLDRQPGGARPIGVCIEVRQAGSPRTYVVVAAIQDTDEPPELDGPLSVVEPIAGVLALVYVVLVGVGLLGTSPVADPDHVPASTSAVST
jgi:hypothetical protein